MVVILPCVEIRTISWPTCTSMQKEILELIQSRHRILRSGVGEHLDMGPVVLLQSVFYPKNFKLLDELNDV
jgi:hypothetical protein